VELEQREVAKMNDFIKLIVPVLLTGMGVLTVDLFTKVSDLQLKFSAQTKYVVILQNLGKQAADHEVRLRGLESACVSKQYRDRNRSRSSGTIEYVSKQVSE